MPADTPVLKIVSVTIKIFTTSRLLELNTGEIIFAGSATGGGMFIGGSDALKLAGRRIAKDLASSALRSAAKVERHITLLITRDTFRRLGGTLTAVRERIGNLSGVNDIFARKMTSSLELDVDFDGTAAAVDERCRRPPAVPPLLKRLFRRRKKVDSLTQEFTNTL